jgi:hypothetical protein
MSEIVSAAVVAAIVSGGTSLAVARLTTRSNARVEREKLDQSRREKALAHVASLNEQMEIVGTAEITDEARLQAARQAQTSLVAVHLMLQDASGESVAVNRLLDALRKRDLVQAASQWARMRDGINAGKLPSA